MINLISLTVKVGKKIILKNINFSFQRGKVYCIVGPNGSGKSTLAHTIAGNPDYSLTSDSKIIFENKIINQLSPDKRAKKGIFITFQNPPSLSGINILDLLRESLTDKKDILKITKQVGSYCRQLKINNELLDRSLNDGFSGGEKKKMEMLQVLIRKPKLLIFDEIDTGIDIDALKIICSQINKLISPQRTIIIITHNFKILRYIKVDKVLVIKAGELSKVGDIKLIKKIEKEGF